MRARAGDPPRTMAQKILAARTVGASLAHAIVQVKVDQIALARSPLRVLAEARDTGLKRSTTEVAVVYQGRCVGERSGPAQGLAERAALEDYLASGFLVARPGSGFPAPVHLERFASPARLCVTDEPRLSGLGGVGMLCMVVPPGQLAEAVVHNSVLLRVPRSVQVSLTGRMRPFVCARDVSLELLRRGVGEVVREICVSHGAPVVLEFSGPSVRTLSVSERAVLAGLAPELGAAAALFVSDERTEVFLRDQRRSKAHRALAADPEAPVDAVVTVDLGAVDPLLQDEEGVVRPVRDLAGKPVSQVILGGDSGATLRDLFAAAGLLKSKKVPPHLDFLVAPPSRQMLEVLAQAGALSDLVATGARLIEPDHRVVTGDLYPPPRFFSPGAGLSVRTSDTEPGRGAGTIVASAETLAYAVASGEVGDPRAFKRPVRITVPRTLPTDDVLVVREKRSTALAARKSVEATAYSPFQAGSFEVVDAGAFMASSPAPSSACVVLCATLADVRALARIAEERPGSLRAVVALHLPADLVARFAGAGVLALRGDPGQAGWGEPERPASIQLDLPPLSDWPELTPLSLALGAAQIELTWLAVGEERRWTREGTARTRTK